MGGEKGLVMDTWGPRCRPKGRRQKRANGGGLQLGLLEGPSVQGAALRSSRASSLSISHPHTWILTATVRGESEWRSNLPRQKRLLGREEF